MLFVTSNSTMRGSVQAFARLRGFRVTAASDGAAALACVRSEIFDLAVCDLDAPGIRAPSFLSSLEAEQSTLAKKLIFLNGSESEERELSGPMLPEPFELDRLEDAAASLIGPLKRSSGAVAVKL